MMSNRTSDDFDRLMTSWMEAEGRVREPAELLDRTLDRTRAARRRPRWLVPEWWLSMQNTARLQAVWRPAPLIFLVALLLVALTLVAILVGGSQPKVPAPFGPAGNGTLVWDANATIYESNADGTGIRTVVSNVPHAATPSVSSDGLRIAFWGDGSPDSLFVANVDGSGVRKLAGDLWIGTDKAPAWSPDRRQLAVSTESGPDRHDERVLVFDVDAGAATTISGAVIGGSRAFRPTWSPDGAWLGLEAVDTNDRPVAYWIGHPDGSGWHQLPTSPLSGFAIGLQWRPSSSGLQAAYTAAPTGGDTSLAMVLDLSNGAERRISSAATEPAHWVVWSPDATRLAWFGGPGGSAILVVDVADPGHVQVLSSRTINSPLSWSPDGRYLVGTNAAGTSLIAVPLDPTVRPVIVDHAVSAGLSDWQRIAP